MKLITAKRRVSRYPDCLWMTASPDCYSSVTACGIRDQPGGGEDQAAERQKQQSYWLQRLERTHIDSERVARNTTQWNLKTAWWQEHLSEMGRSVGSRSATEDTIRAIFA